MYITRPFTYQPLFDYGYVYPNLNFTPRLIAMYFFNVLKKNLIPLYDQTLSTNIYVFFTLWISLLDSWILEKSFISKI